ncbi:MAG TPA: PAS domain-containing protein, partial [Acidimicrobiales bacterium]|nr:PAS domain-containing protein [Acidimicrobiales bacterium]
MGGPARTPTGARSPALSRLVDDAAWALLEAAPDGLLIVDRAGEIVYVSGQAATVLGGSPDELIGRSVDELVPDDVRPQHRAHRTRYQ